MFISTYFIYITADKTSFLGQKYVSLHLNLTFTKTIYETL